METTHDAHLFTHRRAAHRRATWRTRLADELVRYAVVTTLLFLLARPLGVIVALVWGLGIARRFFRGEVEPRLQRRFVREELRRCRHADCAASARDGRARPRSAPELLAEEMGDDPRSGAVDWARTALDELSEGEGRPVPGDARVRVSVSDLLEEVVDVAEERAERHGIHFRLEVDAEGEIDADAARLKSVLLEIVSESVRALRKGARGPARVQVEMGENLAGSEVWVRIRDDRQDAAAGARGVYGSRPVPGLPGATLETQASPRNGVERILTLPKRPARAPVSDGRGDAA